MTARRQNIISVLVVLNLLWIGAMATVHEVVMAGRPLPLDAGITTIAVKQVDPRELRLRDVWDRGIADLQPPSTMFLRTGMENLSPQWSDEPKLQATRVSIHLAQVPIADAIAAIESQSHVRIDPSPLNLLTRVNAPRRFVTLDGDAIPLTEALLRVCTQGNLMLAQEEPSGGQRNIAPIDGSPRVVLSQGNGDRRPGVWSSTGAFTFDLTHIDQSAALSPSGLANDSLSMEFYIRAEPKVWVLSPATATTVTELVDENDKSLMKSPATTGQNGNWIRTINVNLPADHGKWIKRLAADTIWTVGTTPAEITIADVTKAAGTKLSAGAIDAVIQNVNRPTDPAQVNTQLSLAAMYWQHAGSTLDWATIAPLLRRGRVWIDKWGTPSSIQVRADNKAKPPTMLITYQWNNMQRGAAGALHIELPNAVEKVHVPMEFRDIPLP
jgi:hypothetical protein